MKNTFKLAFALAIIPSLLTGCGGGKQNESNKPTTLTIWTSFSRAHTDELITIVNDIVSKDDNLSKVDVMYKGGYDDLHDAVKLAEPSGTMPDIFIFGFITIFNEEDKTEAYEQTRQKTKEFVNSYALPLKDEHVSWIKQSFEEEQYKDVVFNNQTWGFPCLTYDCLNQNQEVIGEYRTFLFLSNKKDYQDKNSVKYKCSYQLAQDISKAYLKMSQE